MLNNNTITTLHRWRKLAACAQFKTQNSKFIITKSAQGRPLSTFFIVYADCTNFSSSITSLLVFVFGCSHLRIL